MRRATFFGAVGAALGLALVCAAGVRAADITLTETGSSLLYPLFTNWAAQYAKLDPSVRIVASSTGSGVGISQAVAGAVMIGTSDAYMSDQEMKQNPDIINVPLAISAQTVNYNLPGLNGVPLRLDGPTLAGIYSGTIRSWDDGAIAALNPGVKLPHHEIRPIRRGDGSGDTFVFTQYLTFSTPAWENGPGYGTTITWPAVPGALEARGNAGMVQTSKDNPYSIAYIGVSFHDEIAQAGLGTALLRNEDGAFVLPTRATVTAAAGVLGPRTPPDERLSLVFAPGADSYPLVNYEYAIVSTKQHDETTAAAIREFLLWSVAMCQGNATKNLAVVRFIPLPDYIRALSEAQIEKIQ
ncbi:MAG TPA: phosphate ABC transporter substrate-binding protein PstS [Candidatus Acidoferrales bacterium]|nr:phosphate ABC transporter substrate-binding protein PstS [Candidatus Acidoferrales bacterium]